MDTLQAILLGIVQGITEFLPVSSSGHLQIAKEVLGVELENNITFDVMLHAATVLSTVVVLWRELLQLLQGLFSRHFNEQQAYILKIVISMIPAGVVGVLFAEQIEAFFASLTFVGAMLMLTAQLLTFAYFAKPRAKKGITYGNAFVIGLAQAAATLPAFRGQDRPSPRDCCSARARRRSPTSRSSWSSRSSWARCCWTSVRARSRPSTSRREPSPADSSRLSSRERWPANS